MEWLFPARRRRRIARNRAEVNRIAVFFTLRTFGRKVPGLRPHLTSYFYATRLYFIRTDFDEVWFWPATELQGLRYDGRAILSFEFADWTYR